MGPCPIDDKSLHEIFECPTQNEMKGKKNVHIKIIEIK